MNSQSTKSPCALDRKGLTAIELTVVMLIISLMATVSVGVYVNYYKANLVESEAGKIDRLLATARGNAIRNAVPTRATFWLDRPAYWIDEGSEADGNLRLQITTPEQVHDLVRISSIDVNSSPTMSSGVAEITFRPDGTSDNATIHLLHKEAKAGDDSEYYTIKVYGPTGRSKVFEKERR